MSGGIVAQPTSWAWSAATVGMASGAVPIHRRHASSSSSMDGIEDLRKERHERIVPPDDDLQARVLCGDAIATHTHLCGCGWCGDVPWWRHQWSSPGLCTRYR